MAEFHYRVDGLAGHLAGTAEADSDADVTAIARERFRGVYRTEPKLIQVRAIGARCGRHPAFEAGNCPGCATAVRIGGAA